MREYDEDARALITRICRDQLSPMVRALARQRGVSLSGLAAGAGYRGVNGLLDAINGRSDVPLSRLLLIAAQLEVWSVEELFGHTGTTLVIEELVRRLPSR